MTSSHQPFFIVGSPRSGTTLLQRMFEAHSDVIFVHESNFFHYCHLYLEKHSTLFTPTPWSKLKENYLHSKYFTQLGLPESLVTAELDRKEKHSWQSVWSESLELFQKQKNKPRLGEKTPHHVLYLDEIFKLYPESKVLLIVRDPRGVIPSMIKANFGPATIQKAMMQWATLNAAGLAYRRRYPHRVLDLHYETLILNPEKTLRNLCDFLKLPFDPGMLKYYELPKEDSPFMQQPIKQGVGQKIYTSSLDQWKTTLGTSDLLYIEKRCRLLMEYLDYHPVNASIKTNTFSRAWLLALALWKTLRWLFSNNCLTRQCYRSQAIGFWMIFCSVKIK